MRRLHLVDGTYELFRAHFSKRPPHADPSGRDRKAVAGIAAAVLALLQDETLAVTHMAVAFDNPIRSFRNDLYAGYKSDEGVDPALRSQFDDAEEAVRALGVRVWSMREHEADDGLASGAHRFAAEVDQVCILSPDKDLGQCVQGTKVVQMVRQAPSKGGPAPAASGSPGSPGATGAEGSAEGAEPKAAPASSGFREWTVIDEEAVRARRGIPPASIADLLALMGDDADGFPGLDGFGEKSAAALLAQFGTIDAIPDDPARWPKGIRGAPKLAATLAPRREEARLYRRLAQLVVDAPLPETRTLDDLRWDGVPRQAFHAFCDRMGLDTFRDRPRRWRGGEPLRA